MATWIPSSYLKFGRERLRPALDLLARINLSSQPKTVVDLGCGAGNIIPFMRERWNAAAIVGVDSSQEMLDQAKKDVLDQNVGIPNAHAISFMKADQNTWRPSGAVDVIFSNAALHWSADHTALFPKLCSKDYLKPGGVLAVQMPDTRKQASHLIMTVAALACGFQSEVAGVRIPRVEQDADFYASILLTPTSPVEALDMWTTVYYQFLEGEDPVPKFTKSTGLMPYLDALGGEKSAKGSRFMKEYISRCALAYPRGVNGRTLFPFTRFFLVASIKNDQAK